MRASHIMLSAALIASSTAASAATLTVGTGEQYASLASAVATAAAGDTIDVYANASPYSDQYVTITQALTIVGVGPSTPVFTQTSGTEIGNLKGFIVVNAGAADNVTITNLSFQNAAISLTNGDNAAGIRYQSGNLTVNNSTFISNQNGILATPNVVGTGSVTVNNSTFTGNGVATGADAGLEHAIYAGQLAQLTVNGGSVTGTLVGSNIKSRAASTAITNTTMDEGVTGTASYAADFSNGGTDVFSGNTIIQDNSTGNDTFVTFDAEGFDYTVNSLLVSGNTFTSTADFAHTGGLPTGVRNVSTSVTASVTCNAFNGVPNLTVGPATLSNNVINGPLPSCATASVPEPSSASALLAGLVALVLAVAMRRGSGISTPA